MEMNMLEKENEISLEEFKNAFYKFKPNKFINFVYSNFSESKTKTFLIKIITGLLLILFIYGLSGSILNFPRNAMLIPILIYCGILALYALVHAVGGIMNTFLIRKIRKELGGINRRKYTELINKYEPYL